MTRAQRPVPPGWEEEGICELNLPGTVEGVLDSHGIITLGRLCSYTPEQLLQLRSVSLRSVAAIYEGLVRYGLLTEVPARFRASLRKKSKKAKEGKRPRARRKMAAGDHG